MTSQAFMLPAMPQAQTVGLNGMGKPGTKSAETDRSNEPADGDQDFLATLNRISDRKTSGSCSSTASEATRPVPENTVMRSGSQEPSPNVDDTADELSPGNQTPVFSPVPPIWIGNSPLLLDIAVSGSKQPESTPEAALSVFMNIFNRMPSQGSESFTEWLAEFGPGGSLGADISPEASNFYLFEQFITGGLDHQAGGSAMGASAHMIGFWPRMASGSEGPVPGFFRSAIADSGVLFTELMALRAALLASMQSGNSTGGFESLETAAGGDAGNAIEAFLLKLANAARTQETEAAWPGNSNENKTAFWTSANPNSEIRPDSLLVQQTDENLPRYKWQADFRAVEQPGQPVASPDGASTQPSEGGNSLKSAMMKDPLVLADAVGRKGMHGESDMKDGGFYFAQDQMPDNLTRTDGATRATGAGHSGLSSHTMNQIVQKAVLSLNNGQSEVQIDLKPDFLGHVRMQIVTENHQVAIKIVTEFPFVKDMLETNLSQLKADLQAQGLQIDKLEVSVAHDSNPQGDTGRELAGASRHRSSGRNINAEATESDDPEPSQNRGTGAAIGETAIDYFA